MVLVGDVAGRIAIIVDDMADTCGTLVKAADVVMEHGAKGAIAIVTHGILSANAIEQINGSQLKKIVITNTVPHEEKKERCDRIETIDISPTVSSAPSHHGELTNCVSSLRKRAGVHTTARVYPSSSSMRL
jgi:ribose-phosphate pyrophosphokinase